MMLALTVALVHTSDRAYNAPMHGGSSLWGTCCTSIASGEHSKPVQNVQEVWGAIYNGDTTLFFLHLCFAISILVMGLL